MEFFKHVSDKILIRFLKVTSAFGRELTREGWDEQKLWREQRLRNLKGLSIISKQRHGKKVERV
jgi:hypothetical protein